MEDNSAFMENFHEATSLINVQEEEEALQHKWVAEMKRWEEAREMYKKTEEVKQLEASQHESVTPSHYPEKAKSIYFNSSLYVPFDDPNRELRWYEKLLSEDSNEKHLAGSLETTYQQKVEPDVLKSPERDKEDVLPEKECVETSARDIILDPGGENQRTDDSDLSAANEVSALDNLDMEIYNRTSQCSSQVEELQTVTSSAAEEPKEVLISAQMETHVEFEEKLSGKELAEIVASHHEPQEKYIVEAVDEQVTSREEVNRGTESNDLEIEIVCSPGQSSSHSEELQTITSSSEKDPKEVLESAQIETRVEFEERHVDKELPGIDVSPLEPQELCIVEAADEQVISREEADRVAETFKKDFEELSDTTVGAAVAAALEEEEEVGAPAVQGHQVPEDTKDIKVGTLIAVLAPEGEDWKSVEIPSVDVAAGAPAVAPSAPAAPPAPASTPSAAAALPAVAAASHGNYGPSVRLLLEKFGLDEEQVPPSGPHGKLLKGDVLRLVKEKNIQPIAVAPAPPPEAPKAAAAAPAPAAPQAPKPQPAPIVKPGDGYQDIEVSNMRRTIAKRLMQSKGGIAHSYGTIDCSVDKLVSLRKQFKEDGVNVSMNDLIIKAVAVALHQCPEMNSIWQGNQLIQSESVDISVAVATDAGLITPIVHNADMLGIQEIAAKVRDLASRARENKLKLEEFQGGSFTISNLGMFGISEFSAIINPPQCGILAVGGGRLTVDESGSLSTRMNATLSYDRLGVDDDSAAVFLSILKDLLEEPKTLMLGALPIAQLARGLL